MGNFNVTSPAFNGIGCSIRFNLDAKKGFFVVDDPSEEDYQTYNLTEEQFTHICENILGHKNIDFQIDNFTGWDTNIDADKRNKILAFLA